MTDLTQQQIAHMVSRFLGWKLPEDFSPDAGISFKAAFNEHTAYPMKHEPSGTNLFDAAQAEAMVRYMIEGMPLSEKLEPNPAWEAKADAFHAAATAEHGVEPEQTLKMLERWKSDAEPANEQGQVTFSRAMLDSATDALRALLAERERLREALRPFARVAEQMAYHRDHSEDDFTEVRSEMTHERDFVVRKSLGLPPTPPGKQRTSSLFALDILQIRDWLNARKALGEVSDGE